MNEILQGKCLRVAAGVRVMDPNPPSMFALTVGINMADDRCGFQGLQQKHYYEYEINFCLYNPPTQGGPLKQIMYPEHSEEFH